MQVMGTSLVTIREHLAHWKEVETVVLCRATCLQLHMCLGELPPSWLQQQLSSHLPPKLCGLQRQLDECPSDWRRVTICSLHFPSEKQSQVALHGVHHQKLSLPFDALLTQTSVLSANPSGTAGCNKHDWL